MRSKSLVLLLLALGCGLVAAIGINQVMANRGQQGGPTEVQAIYVAVKDIPSRAQLKIEDLKLEEWPKDKIPSRAISKAELLKDRSAKFKIFEGEPILESKLFSPDDPGMGAAFQIPEGYQVVAIKVDDVSGISKLVLPGDIVDVQVFVRRNPNMNVNETMTLTVLQKARVFAVNDIWEGDQAAEQDSGTIAAKTVSLVVLPDDAKRVTLAAELGKVRLTLRGPNDKTEAANTIVSVQELMDFSNGGRPVEDKGSGPGLLDVIKGAVAAAPQDTEPTLPVASDAWTMLVLAGGESPRQVQFQNGVRTDMAPTDGGSGPQMEPEPPLDPSALPAVEPEPPFDPAADIDPQYAN